ncbi:MAG: hypothetical protein K6F35_08420 [Lachnospiraceae bacterium]|nr:hypothetical protein [Lachnospiraceae bacterium]
MLINSASSSVETLGVYLNPYDELDDIIRDGSRGSSGMDDHPRIIEIDKNVFSVEMVKGQKFTIGKGDWRSEASSVVGVNKKKGVVSAKKKGEAVLTESKSGVTVNVKVYEPKLKGAKKRTLYVRKAKSQHRRSRSRKPV